MIVTPQHTLDAAILDILPGGDLMENRRFLVIHFTGGWRGKSSIDFWRQPEAKGANAHLVIDRDGTLYQCRRFNRTAGHAGKSTWKDPKTGKRYTGLNNCSIGIELANAGDLDRATYPATMPLGFAGQPIPKLKARHKNGGPVKGWELYDKRQLDVLAVVAATLVKRYNLDDVVGHEDIAPDRKNDPGPAFPMAEFRAALGFTAPLP
jgi:N-acetylmuramoyl-L-alanine amidase